MEQLFYQEDNFQEEANCKVIYSFQKEVGFSFCQGWVYKLVYKVHVTLH